MAESVIPDASLSVGSEAVLDIVCQPCSSDGKNVEAEVYCRECREHLCGQCIKHHKKFSSMKHHQLVDKDAKPRAQDAIQVRDVCAERCEEHKEEVIKYYCPDHDALACGVCVTLHHKRCDNMDYIQDVAEDKVHDFMTVVDDEDCTEKYKDTVTLALESKHRASDCHAKVIQDLDVYRETLVDAVDRNIQGMKDHAGQILAQDTERMNKLVAMGNTLRTGLQSMKVDSKSLMENKQFCKLFVEMIRKFKTFDELHEKMERMGDAEEGVSTYTFEPDEDLPATLDRQGGLGKLVVESFGKISAEHVADINVESTDNNTTCKIKGMAITSQDKVVMTDYNNGTIKLLDTVNNKIISELSPENRPWDVAVCNDTVAATLPDAKKIVFLKHDGGLVHDRDISVGGRCRGIDWYDDKLFVTFDGDDDDDDDDDGDAVDYYKKLEVMTTAGVVLEKFTTTDTGEQLFNRPRYVAVSAATKQISVSDGQGQLIMLDFGGKQTNVVSVNSPRQLVLDKTGMVFICEYGTDSINAVSFDGEEEQILLTDADGIEDPYSICYCEDTRRVYVGMKSNVVKVYQIL